MENDFEAETQVLWAKSVATTMIENLRRAARSITEEDARWAAIVQRRNVYRDRDAFGPGIGSFASLKQFLAWLYDHDTDEKARYNAFEYVARKGRLLLRWESPEPPEPPQVPPGEGLRRHIGALETWLKKARAEFPEELNAIIAAIEGPLREVRDRFIDGPKEAAA